MRLATSSGFSLLTLLATLMLAVNPQAHAADGTTRASEFKLANGMDVVVIPDHRSPVVTHMVWYRVGAADEVRGTSGIAHFLEHLMFKSTDKIPVGEFSKIVGRLGGQDNAFTGNDATAYFQRVSKDRLGKMMEMEADRMVHLRLDEKEVLTERNVILEERRSRIENNPSSILDEQMNAALYQNHPYGKPVIGWYHEMAKLSRQNALDFYKHYYAPNNAILVVSGDVTADEVRKLADETYGKIPANPTVPTTRQRPTDPPQLVARRLTLKDPRAGNYSFQRYYQTPSYVTAKPGEAEALDILMKIAGSGSTSRIYKKLVVESKLASSAGGDYSGYGLDGGTISLYAVAADGVPLEKVEAATDDVLANIVKNGVTETELTRAKNSYLADYVYDSDNQATLARRYGWNLAVGRTVADVEAWPANISKVTADDVKKVAAKYLDLKDSVTGYLIPDQSGVAQAEDLPAPSPSGELR
ncbi:MAG: insulinase family protein [Proteobacteria bacterium]|nr:insulinase family protein [Pseudomonadota bacterium]